jgi:hypothetical protein
MLLDYCRMRYDCFWYEFSLIIPLHTPHIGKDCVELSSEPYTRRHRRREQSWFERYVFHLWKSFSI